MKTFASHPVMLEDADLDYVTGGGDFSVAGDNSANYADLNANDNSNNNISNSGN